MAITREVNSAKLNVKTLGPVQSGKQTYISNIMNNINANAADSAIYNTGMLWAGMTDNSPAQVLLTTESELTDNA